MDLNIRTKADVARARAGNEYVERGGALHPPAAEPPAPAPPAGKVTTADDLYARLLKYIPAPLIGIYLMLQNLVVGADSPSRILAWGLLVVFLALTVVYLVSRQVRRPLQIGLSLLAFTAWAAASPGPFQLMDAWDSVYGTLALGLVAALLVAVKLPPLPEE